MVLRSVKIAVFVAIGLYVITLTMVGLLASQLPTQSSSRMPPEHHLPSRSRQTTTRRFPEYGTREFYRQCSWTRKLAEPPQKHDCTLFVRPIPRNTEGISHWISQIATGFLLARQVGCILLFDYGEGVEIHQVLEPLPSLGSGPDELLNNWRVPSGFICSRHCIQVPFKFGSPSSTELRTFGSILGTKSPGTVPFYRYAYLGSTIAGRSGHEKYHLNRSEFRDLDRNLPGFQLETGMACSIGSLFHLAPSATKFEPELFTTILPTLKDDNALVISLYIRTGHTDRAFLKEISHEVPEESVSVNRVLVKTFIRCAMQLEGEHLSGRADPDLTFSRIVWMLLTDSTDLKQYVKETYSNQDTNVLVPADQRKWKSKVIRREVMTTGSRGVHTKKGRSPSTSDFAEALIDWYLIGESDVVISNGPSFGATGALRTARPLRDYKTCSKAPLVYD